jgi:hypothetical protein
VRETFAVYDRLYQAGVGRPANVVSILDWLAAIDR